MARRRVLGIGLGGIAGLGLGAQTPIGGRKAMAQGAPQGTPETVAYVSNAGSKEVFVLAMNRATGALELIEKTPVPGTDKPSPASLPMATSPDKHFLYAQLRSEPYPVSTFAIDRTTGRLRHLAATPLVDQMAYINTDRTGKFLLAASYVGAKLAIYPINAQSIVEAKATQILDTKPKAHCVVIDAGNKNVYVPVLGGDIDEPRMDGTAARVVAWSRRDRRARSANPDRRTQSDGSRHTGNGRLCIERRQQGSVRPGDKPGDGRA